jgi:hypothetical protein
MQNQIGTAPDALDPNFSGGRMKKG